MENTRELAVSMLLEITEKNRFSHLVIREVLDKYDYLTARDKAFLKRLTEGTLERRIQLDYLLDAFSKVPVRKMKPFIRSLLRISVYQLFFMDGVPDRAVCNEAVKLAEKHGFRNLGGFCNGVLRNMARARDEDRILWPDQEKDPVLWLSVQYSMPRWLVEKFLKERGREETEAMLQNFLHEKGITVRFRENLSEQEKENLQNSWQQARIGYRPHPWHPGACLVENVEGLRQLPGFASGQVTVQDSSSMLVCEAAGITTGNRVIDVCAAPGGKAAHAAEKLWQGGFVSARDLTEDKAALIRQTIDRMQLTNMEVLVWDARLLREEDRESADVVLADLPCSGLGIMGRKKDIKYHVSTESLMELAALQREILSTVWQYVKPGGILLYSTCTVNREENEDNVAWLTEHFPFQRESLAPFLPEPLQERGSNGMLQLLPGAENDGFFLARLRRR